MSNRRAGKKKIIFLFVLFTNFLKACFMHALVAVRNERNRAWAPGKPAKKKKKKRERRPFYANFALMQWSAVRTKENTIHETKLGVMQQ